MGLNRISAKQGKKHPARHYKAAKKSWSGQDLLYRIGILHSREAQVEPLVADTEAFVVDA